MTTTEAYIVHKSRFIREYRRWRRKILAGEKVYVTRCGKDATLQIYLSDRDYERLTEKLGTEFDDWSREKYGKKRRNKVQPGINKGWDDTMDAYDNTKSKYRNAFRELASMPQEQEQPVYIEPEEVFAQVEAEHTNGELVGQVTTARFQYYASNDQPGRLVRVDSETGERLHGGFVDGVFTPDSENKDK